MRDPWWRWAAPLAVLELCVLPSWACDPLNATFEEVEKAKRYRAAELQGSPDPGDSLTVMTYNIKFGGGRIRFFFECPGERVHMSRSEVLGNLEALAEKIRQVEPDLLLLQEVDVQSDRVAEIDQVQWLLDHTGFDYGVYASQWRARYVPKHGIGAVNSGNAILSRWPFREATRLALPLIGSQDWITRYFYLKRNLLKSRLEIPGVGELVVLNTHLSAYSKDGTRLRQVSAVEEELRQLDDQGEPFVFGGDLNLIPPESERARDFADEVCEKDEFEPTDYSDKLDALRGLYESWEPAISLEEYAADNDRYFTYTGKVDAGWTRKLDYLFTNRAFADDSGLVHQERDQGGMSTIERSDHAPVTAEYPVE